MLDLPLHGNLDVVCFLRMCMLDNKLQTFFNLVLFQQLCGRDVFDKDLHPACEQVETLFCQVECFSHNVCMADFFTENSGMIFLALKFDAPARCTSTE